MPHFGMQHVENISFGLVISKGEPQDRAVLFCTDKVCLLTEFFQGDHLLDATAPLFGSLEMTFGTLFL